MNLSVETYGALGMKVVERFENASPKASVVLMEDHQGTGVELWLLADQGHPDAVIIDGHVAYESDSLEADTKLLLGRGFKIEKPQDEDDTLRFIQLLAPNSKSIELCQYK